MTSRPTDYPEMPRPLDSTWTEDQWKAISLRGGNMLVAAAAGSGKTAVLVERIIRQVTDTAHPLDVDRMLVATFTKAAATEMRQRIRAALDKEVLQRPEDERLRRQLALLGQASITTLHSFCLEVIRRYYSLIPLDPGFRIASENESRLLRQEILEELFEEKYGEEEERDSKQFHRLMNWFGGERSDDAAIVLVERLYHFARSHPWPEHWLRQTAAHFEAANGAALQNTPWVSYIMQDIRVSLEGMEALLQQGIDTARLPGGPAAYADSLNEDLELIHQLQDAVMQQPWTELYLTFQNAGFGKLKAVRKEGIDPNLQETVKQLRENAKKSLADLKTSFFGRTPDEFAQELREAAPLMSELAELVIRFSNKYQQEKQRRGWVDFSDLEHYALQILRDPASVPDHVQPSAAALEYQERFDEVMLDEYQDTNSVQEQLIRLISRQEQGNRFMVGDVKQSIYRFRLAEPGLFMEKYHTYTEDWQSEGRRIDLSRNFRSRQQVVDAVNMIFRQVMNEKVSEIRYDERAELVAGAKYPPGEEQAYAPEFWLIDRAGAERTADAEDTAELPVSSAADEAELEAARLEAQAIAARVREMVSPDGRPLMIYDKSVDGLRPAEYRDMVILLRSVSIWAPMIVEELQLLGIPAYSDLEQGYFEAVEVDIMLSLLEIIDNPQQDIPLASVLRSPIVGLNEDELAAIRLFGKDLSYYEAMLLAAEQTAEHPGSWNSKLLRFIEQLSNWRAWAREEELGELIWRIYRETGYVDWLGGLPGGIQRQNNLRILYDRARQFERSTSSRGLFRFLRFIRRLKDNGGDLGSAVSGTQENAIRVMTIHKSKGLEFPVVFLAGMSKMFNMQDLNASFLMHKELGFGPKFVDEDTRVSYPMLPNLAIRRQALNELLAEEMRVLYVALTRPRDKLIMIGTVRGLDKKISAWSQIQNSDQLELPDHLLARGRSYLDWLGPAMMRHRSAAIFRERNEAAAGPYSDCLVADPSDWQIRIIDSRELRITDENDELSYAGPRENDPKWQALQEKTEVTLSQIHDHLDTDTEDWQRVVYDRLSWQYPYENAVHTPAKTTVSELKRQLATEDAPDADLWEGIWNLQPLLNSFTKHNAESDHTALSTSSSQPREAANNDTVEDMTTYNQTSPSSLYHDGTLKLQRPKFMEKRGLSGAERGTAYHTMMQRIPLHAGPVDAALVDQVREQLVELQILTQPEAKAVKTSDITAFFTSELGQRLIRSEWVRREMAFSYGIPVNEQNDIMLTQGIVDCLFRENGRTILIDYKTDRIAAHEGGLESLEQRYRLQLELYAQAVQESLGQQVDELWLYFFDGATAVRLHGDK